MKERLLLDRVTLYSAYIAPRDIQCAAPVVTYLAYSGLTIRNRTTVAARVTANPTTIKLLVEITFANVFVDNVAQGWHEAPL